MPVDNLVPGLTNGHGDLSNWDEDALFLNVNQYSVSPKGLSFYFLKGQDTLYQYSFIFLIILIRIKCFWILVLYAKCIHPLPTTSLPTFLAVPIARVSSFYQKRVPYCFSPSFRQKKEENWGGKFSRLTRGNIGFFVDIVVFSQHDKTKANSKDEIQITFVLCLAFL